MIEPTGSCNAKIKKMHFEITKNAKYAKKNFLYSKKYKFIVVKNSKNKV
jgi:hypothetical protein